jgi:hypothetical protein
MKNPNPQELLSKQKKNSENSIIKCIFLRAAIAMLPAESANCMQSSAGCYTAGRT